MSEIHDGLPLRSPVRTATQPGRPLPSRRPSRRAAAAAFAAPDESARPGGSEFIMRTTCPNRPGIVATLAGTLHEAGFDIRDSQQFDDVETDYFFVRIVFGGHVERHSEDQVRQLFASAVHRYDITLDIRDRARMPRVVLMASRFDHCLADLLYRWRTGDIEMDPVAIVSNHPLDECGHLDFDGIPFHFLKPDKADPKGHEDRLREIVDDTGAELVVLARYMQILSDSLATDLAGRCINIHHSFLAGFKGTRPYHQAHARGVKMIGATAHYVTADLDEGPIIVQDVERVSHRDGPDQLVRRGRDIERRVLAEAIRHHIDGRVFINGRRTVVFPE